MDLDAWVLSWEEIEYLAQQKKDVRVVSVDGSEIYSRKLKLSKESKDMHMRCVSQAVALGAYVPKRVKKDYPWLDDSKTDQKPASDGGE
jgi:hypothetical protein